MDADASLKTKENDKDQTVSWNLGATEMAEAPSSASKDNNAVEKESTDQIDVNKPRPKTGSDDGTIKKSHVRRITLTDVKASPLEDEAEAAILQAIEKRDMKENLDPAFSLLSAVPKDTAHMFEDIGRHGDKSGIPSIREKGQIELSESNDSSGYSGTKHTIKDMAMRMRRMQGAAANISDQSRDGGYLKRLAMSQRRINVDGVNHTSAKTTRVESKETDSTTKAKADVLLNSVDSLFHNASMIFGDRGRNKVESMDIESQMPTIDEPNDSDSSQWRRLRNVVKFSPALQGDRNKPEEEKRESHVSMGGASSLGMEMENDVDDSNHLNESSNQKGRNSKAATKLRRKMFRPTEVISETFGNNKGIIMFFLKYVVLVIFVPVLAVASLLFYAFDNPLISVTQGSYSWWLIFIGRQVLTLSLSKAFEMFFIDFCSLRTRLTLSIWGPFVTLLIVQARGWPYTLTFWAIWDFGILYGSRSFAKHWLFWQNTINMFNENNPAGNILDSDIYMLILIAAVVAGVATTIKRVLLAAYLGKRTCEHYEPQLEKLMKKMLLLNEIGHLAQEIYESSHYKMLAKELLPGDGQGFDFKALRKSSGGDDDTVDDDRNDDDDDDDDDEDDDKSKSECTPQRTDGKDLVTPQLDTLKELNTVPQFGVEAHLNLSDKMSIRRMVGEWEEPEIKSAQLMMQKTTINDVLQFRKAISCINEKYPFSAAFGLAKTREECIESAQDIFQRLLLLTPGNEVLPFHTVCLIALDNNGELNEKKMKALIRLLRPDRNGNISALDFVKSCDHVYKSLRMFRAAVANSSQIDNACEKLVNVIFYFVLLMIVLTIVKLDPWTLFLSLSGLILSFAFMFKNAASKYFDGLLFILVRRPYDIGDRIHVSDVQKDTSSDGSSCWYVEEVTLFTTTVRFATTNEVATYANGSLANSRIINGKRSPKALIYIYFKFGIDVPYEKVKIFKSAIENFVKARPREWLSFNGFRARSVDASLGYVDYVIVLTHIESWQSASAIRTSKADVASFGNEVAKKLDMRYSAPPLPVKLGFEENSKNQEELQRELSLLGKGPESSPSVATDETPNLAAIAELFNKPDSKKMK